MKRIFSCVAASLALLPSPATAQLPAGETPALGTNRITQAQLLQMSVDEVRLAGFQVFVTPFNKLDGFGDGPYDPLDPDPTSAGNRPYLQNNDTFVRIQGLDSQTCQECHFLVSTRTVPNLHGIGGVGGIAATAMPNATEIDVDDEAGNGFAATDGRLINPPFLFGAGGVELVSKEMTLDLQALKALAQRTPNVPVPLVTKGVGFGTIVYDSASGTLDTSAVEGIDPDLVVRPFGRKGDNFSVRQFALNAMQFHHGMQPVELFGAGVDDDGDGVSDEILIGEMSALHVFGVANERPVQVGGNRPHARRGRRVFHNIGCTDCHVPTLTTTTTKLPVAFPEVETDPLANVFVSYDLTRPPTGFEREGSGIRVEMFSDLKRHEMGARMAESTGHPLDSWFITPRLWGIADTAPYMHDGRALTLTEAIEMHGGEGLAAANAFRNLADDEKVDLLTFLRTLRTPRTPSEDLVRASLAAELAQTEQGSERERHGRRGL